MDLSFLVVWITGAVAVIGVMEWAKNFAPKAPTWVWAIAMPILAIGYAIAPDFVRLGAGIVAVSHIGYANIIQLIKNKTAKAASDAGGAQ